MIGAALIGGSERLRNPDTLPDSMTGNQQRIDKDEERK
jgi:hypothetical protein